MRLLVVEDEERVASFLHKGLRAHGYDVEWVQTGQDALRRLMHPGISLVILDLGLPDLDGLDVLEGLRGRGSAVPVLVLSARGRVDDRVTGLNLGADDYLGKPFAFEELLARVRANLRPRTADSPGVLQAGRICIDPLRREVTVDGRAVSLSARETNLVDVYVGYLRRKLGEPVIETVRGAGYCLQTEGQTGPRNEPDRHEQTDHRTADGPTCNF